MRLQAVRSQPMQETDPGDEPRTVDRVAELRRLRVELVRRQAEWRDEELSARCGTGWPLVDALLGGGFLKGRVSALGGPSGAGATTLAARAIAAAQAAGQGCAWVDLGTLCAPGLEALGVRLPRLLAVRPPSDEAGWAAQLLARSGAFALVVVDLPPGGLASAAAQRLADAARAGNCAVLLLSGEVDVPAAFKARLDASTDGAPLLALVADGPPASTDDSEPKADEASPALRRKVRLWVERSRRGGEVSGAVSLTAPPRPLEPGPWRGRVAPGLGTALDDYIGVPIRPLVAKLHTRPRSRYREPPIRAVLPSPHHRVPLQLPSQANLPGTLAGPTATPPVTVSPPRPVGGEPMP